MRAGARFAPGDVLRMPDGAGTSTRFVVAAETEGGWTLVGPTGAIVDRGRAEVAAAHATGRLVHLPAAAGGPSADKTTQAGRVAAERRLAFVTRVDRTCPGPMPTMKACSRVAAAVHAENAARWSAEDAAAGRAPPDAHAPSASTVRRWYLRWSENGRDPRALVPWTHMCGNRVPRHGRPPDGSPDAYEFIEGPIGGSARHGAVAAAYRSYVVACREVDVTPVSDAAFRRHLSAGGRRPGATSRDGAERVPDAVAPIRALAGAVSSEATRDDAPPRFDGPVRHAELRRASDAMEVHCAVRARGGCAKPRVLALAGPPGSGMRTIVRDFLERLGAPSAAEVGGMVRFEATSPSWKPKLAIDALAAFGFDPSPRIRLEAAVASVSRQIALRSTRLVVVEQAHRLTLGVGTDRDRRLDHVRAFVDGVNVPMVFVGGPEVQDLVAELGPDRVSLHAVRPYGPDDSCPAGPYAELAAGLAARVGVAWPPPGDFDWDARLCAATGGGVVQTARHLGRAAALGAGRGGGVGAALMSEVDAWFASERAVAGSGGAGDARGHEADPFGAADPFSCPADILPEVWEARAREVAASFGA